VIAALREARAVLVDRELTTALGERPPGNGGGADGRRFGEAALAFSAGLKQVEAWGVVVRDVDSGICDFPGRRDGRDVYLCWKFGEERIDYWHDLEAGFAGRAPIDGTVE